MDSHGVTIENNYIMIDGIPLHRIIYIMEHGHIPKGNHIHHRDKNTFNNSPDNLEAIEGTTHIIDHMKARTQREYHLDKYADKPFEAVRLDIFKEGNKWCFRFWEWAELNNPSKTEYLDFYNALGKRGSKTNYGRLSKRCFDNEVLVEGSYDFEEPVLLKTYWLLYKNQRFAMLNFI
jgi:hypothetical protein